MRKLNSFRVVLLACVLAVAVCLVVVPSAVNANGGGADVITAFGCVSTTNGLPGSYYTTDTHAVTTPSGNVKMTCNFVYDVAIAPPKAIHNRGYDCYVPGGTTTNSFTVTDTEGHIMMRCIIKANQ